MKNWTRLLAILLMLGMLLSLAACGGKSADKVVRELVNEDADAILLKNFASPLDYYKAVEQRRADELMGLVNGSAVLQDAQNGVEFFRTEFLTLLDQSVLDQELLDDLTRAAGMDLSWIKSFGLIVTSGRDGNLGQSSAALRLNDTDIIHMDMVMDSAAMTAYVSVPELSDSAFFMDMAEMLSSSGGFSTEEVVELFSGAGANDAGVYLEIINRYFGIVLDNITKVEVSEGSVSAGGISCECNIAKVTIEAEDVRRIGNAVLDAAAQDQDVEDLAYRILKSAGEYSGSRDNFHAYFLNLLDSAREDLEDVDDSGYILMTVYIDEKGEILGRCIQGISDEGDKALRLSYITARDGWKLGLDAEFGVFNKYGSGENAWEYQTVVKLSGAGSYSSDSGKLTGDFLATYYELDDYRGQREETNLELFNVKVDATLCKEGLLGEILLTPCEDLINLILDELGDVPDSVVKLLRSLTVAIVNSSTSEKLDCAIILRSSGQDLLTMKMTMSPTEKFEITVPANPVDMDTWTSSIGFGALTTIIGKLNEAGVPSSLFNSLIG